MKALRVLFVLENLEYGGSQTQLLELCARLRRHCVVRVVLLSGNAPLLPRAQALGLDVRFAARGDTAGLACIWHLPGELRRFRPDVLVPFTVIPNIWGRVVGWMAGVPVLGNCRGGGAPRRQYERFLWRLARLIVVNAPWLRETLTAMNVPASRVRMVPNGVDTARFMPSSQVGTGKKVLSVGRLVQDKDHATLIRAVARLDLTLTIVGEGPLEGSLRELVASEGLEDSVRIVPPVDDLSGHYHEADIFALPSRREACPNVLLEAMSCGVPVVASQVGGVPYALGMDGADDAAAGECPGLLFAPGDVAGCAMALARLAESAKLRADMGAAGRRRAESFSFERMAGAYHKLLLDVSGA